MTEVTGFAARTIHRVPEVNPKTGGLRRTDDGWAYFEPFLIRRRPSTAQSSPRARRGVLADANRCAVAAICRRNSATGIRFFPGRAMKPTMKLIGPTTAR